MRVWHSRLVIALLSIGLVQAGVAACCQTLEQISTAARRDCHHTPRTSHSACAAADAVKGATAQSSIDHARGAATVLGTPHSHAMPELVLVTALNAPVAAPWFPDDIHLRVHVFLI